MTRDRTPSRSGSSSSYSSYSSTSSVKNENLSVNFYGNGDPARNNPPAHWGIMRSKAGDATGDLYHVRKDHTAEFYYPGHAEKKPVESSTMIGRSNLASMSKSNAEKASRNLDRFGRKTSNLPRENENCQNWTTNAVGTALEGKGFVPRGTSGTLQQNIGKASQTAGASLQKTGVPWIPRTNDAPPRTGPADAAYGRAQERRPVGRLDTSKFANLSGGTAGRRTR